MRILFDQNVPRKLRPFLEEHEVMTADEQGWATISNGELLKTAEAAGFDLVVTCDQNITWQQNLKERKIGLLVLGTNDWNILKSQAGRIAASINRAQQNGYELVEFELFPKPRLPRP